LFNVYGVNDVRQTVMQLYINHWILIKFQNFCKEDVGLYMNLLILWEMSKNYLNSKESLLYLFVRRVIKQIVVITEAYKSYQLYTKFYPKFFSQG
jgi:hypothetical protein